MQLSGRDRYALRAGAFSRGRQYAGGLQDVWPTEQFPAVDQAPDRRGRAALALALALLGWGTLVTAPLAMILAGTILFRRGAQRAAGDGVAAWAWGIALFPTAGLVAILALGVWHWTGHSLASLTGTSAGLG